MNMAVTGSVGSGKGGVSAMIAGLLPAVLVDADAICRELLLPGRMGWQDLRSGWGRVFFDDIGELDRVKLREAVFKESEVRQRLEKLLHPLVQSSLVAHMASAEAEGRHLVAEIPLLFEVGWQDRFDCVVTVYVPPPLARKRTAIRDGVAVSQVESILALQLTPEEKAELADYVIDNSESWSQTVVQTAVVCRQIQQLERVAKRAGGGT